MGPNYSPNVIVEDPLPSGYTYVSHSTIKGTYESGSGLWKVGEMLSGTTATLTIKAVVNNAGIYTNTATILGDAEDKVTGNNTSSVSITVCKAGATPPLFNK